MNKAIIAGLVGSRDGLASERAYTFRILPKGVARGLADTIFFRHAAGVLQAAAIVGGLAMTTSGYMVGLARRRLSAREAIAFEAPPIQEYAGDTVS